MPKVSVLIPVYKTKKEHLKEAIQSILDQTFSDFELLILDDAPDDNREDLVRSYSDNRIKYSKNEQNLGISRSRNKLIKMAQGEYLAVMDHDDISFPERLEKQVRYLDTHPDVGVVSGQAIIIPAQKTLTFPSSNFDIKLALTRDCALIHSASMIRKSVLTENNICYEEGYSPAEDYALWCRLIEYTNFHNLEDFLIYYRDHPESTSHKQKEKMEFATWAIWDRIRREHPALYAGLLSRIKHVTDIKLFGFIPFLRFVSQGNKTKIYL